MRKLCFVLCLFAFPASAAAQHSFSLPPIGGPLPSIGLRLRMATNQPAAVGTPAGAGVGKKPHPTVGERLRSAAPDPGDHQRRGDHQRPGDHQRSRHRAPQVVYVMQPVSVRMEPQIVIVERPVTRTWKLKCRSGKNRSSSAATEGTGAAIRAER